MKFIDHVKTGAIYVVIALFWLIVLGLPVYGMIAVSNEHRYTNQQRWISYVFFPYAGFIGGKEIYFMMTTPGEKRERFSQCLDSLQALDVNRRLRLAFCECTSLNGLGVDECRASVAKKFRVNP